MLEQNVSLHNNTDANINVLASDDWLQTEPRYRRGLDPVLRLWPLMRLLKHPSALLIKARITRCYPRIGQRYGIRSSYCCYAFCALAQHALLAAPVNTGTAEQQTVAVIAAIQMQAPSEWALQQNRTAPSPAANSATTLIETMQTETTTLAQTATSTSSRLTRQLQADAQHRHYTFTYQWDGLPPLRFTLSPGATEQRIAARRRYSTDMLNARLRQYLLQQQTPLQQTGIRLELSPPAQPLSYQLSGIDATAVRNAQTALHQALAEQRTAYLQQNYFYQLPPTQGQSWIVVDHVRIMQESLPLLQPMAAALSAQLGQQNIRQISSHLLRFIQQIPYNDLSSRRDSQGSAFAPPWQLLHEHRGDCDSKAVLLAGILRQLFPRLQIAIIYLSDHAVLAAQIPPLPGETKVELNGQSLLILDATGPALLPPGKTGSKYQLQLQNRQFSYRFFPVSSQ